VGKRRASEAKFWAQMAFVQLPAREVRMALQAPLDLTVP
jgi:hypothetical protein